MKAKIKLFILILSIALSLEAKINFINPVKTINVTKPNKASVKVIKPIKIDKINKDLKTFKAVKKAPTVSKKKKIDIKTFTLTRLLSYAISKFSTMNKQAKYNIGKLILSKKLQNIKNLDVQMVEETFRQDYSIDDLKNLLKVVQNAQY